MTYEKFERAVFNADPTKLDISDLAFDFFKAFNESSAYDDAIEAVTNRLICVLNIDVYEGLTDSESDMDKQYEQIEWLKTAAETVLFKQIAANAEALQGNLDAIDITI